MFPTIATPLSLLHLKEIIDPWEHPNHSQTR